MCGSDIPALLGHTRKMLFLEDGEMAELGRDGVQIETLAGAPVTRSPKHIDWSPVQAEKGGYKHFMLKEIFEQPRAVEDTLRGRIHLDEGELVDAELGLDAEAIKSVDRVYFSPAARAITPASLAVTGWSRSRACRRRPSSRARFATESRSSPSAIWWWR